VIPVANILTPPHSAQTSAAVVLQKPLTTYLIHYTKHFAMPFGPVTLLQMLRGRI